ncbi:MAG: hypothetical protein HOE90_22190 [Bacteriovoracaceae bacterium]|jgi:hypothetical protein|nr:hypothetical protein [Bacteriovoracaceae bacterium]
MKLIILSMMVVAFFGCAVNQKQQMAVSTKVFGQTKNMIIVAKAADIKSKVLEKINKDHFKRFNKDNFEYQSPLEESPFIYKGKVRNGKKEKKDDEVSLNGVKTWFNTPYYILEDDTDKFVVKYKETIYDLTVIGPMQNRLRVYKLPALSKYKHGSGPIILKEKTISSADFQTLYDLDQGLAMSRRDMKEEFNIIAVVDKKNADDIVKKAQLSLEKEGRTTN